RLRALLEEAGLVDDQHPGGIAQVLERVGPQVVAHRIGVPRRGIQEALNPLWPALADLLRHLPAVLPLHRLQERPEVPPGPPPRLGPGECRGNPPVRRPQPLPPPNHRPARIRLPHPLPSASSADEAYHDLGLSVAVVLETV